MINFSEIGEEYLVVSSQCRFTIGAKRCLVCDFQRIKSFIISREYGLLLEMMNRTKIKMILEQVDEGSQEHFSAFLEFLIKNEIAFLTKDLSLFPETNDSWDSPFTIINAILDFKYSHYNFKKAINELGMLGCKNIQVRFFKKILLDDVVEILNCIKDTEVVYVELLIPHATENSQEQYNNLLFNFNFLSNIFVYGSPEYKDIPYAENTPGFFEVEFGNTHFIQDSIADEKACGLIHERNMNYYSLPLFRESKAFNGCLNRKISVSHQGEIKNCPSMKRSYGHIDDTSLLQVVNQPDFQKLFHIKKEEILVCKDCEFRNICTDCRAYLEDHNNLYSKPLKCGYDPYTGEWHEWNLNPLRSKAMEFYEFEVK